METTSSNFIVRIAGSQDYKYIPDIVNEIAVSAAQRKVSKGNRTPGFIAQKMKKGLAIIVLNPQNGSWVGFSYMEVWQHQKYIANSGLIVAPQYRGMGISKMIKMKMFEECRKQFPEAKLLSLTANPAVIHINQVLGFKQVSYQRMMKDKLFLEGEDSWIDFKDLLNKKDPEHEYIAMVYEPESA